jgi:hypothetical protein
VIGLALAGYGADPIRARLDIAGDLRTQLDDHRVDLVSWAELGQRHGRFDRFDVGPARSAADQFRRVTNHGGTLRRSPAGKGENVPLRDIAAQDTPDGERVTWRGP